MTARPIRIKRRFGTGAPDRLEPGELAAAIHQTIELFIGDQDRSVRTVVAIPPGGEEGDLLVSDGAGGLKWRRP